MNKYIKFIILMPILCCLALAIKAIALDSGKAMVVNPNNLTPNIASPELNRAGENSAAGVDQASEINWAWQAANDCDGQGAGKDYCYVALKSNGNFYNNTPSNVANCPQGYDFDHHVPVTTVRDSNNPYDKTKVLAYTPDDVRTGVDLNQENFYSNTTNKYTCGDPISLQQIYTQALYPNIYGQLVANGYITFSQEGYSFTAGGHESSKYWAGVPLFSSCTNTPASPASSGYTIGSLVNYGGFTNLRVYNVTGPYSQVCREDRNPDWPLAVTGCCSDGACACTGNNYTWDAFFTVTLVKHACVRPAGFYPVPSVYTYPLPSGNTSYYTSSTVAICVKRNYKVANNPTLFHPTK
ncbi:MAG: hypothetical protein SFW66_04465 [Gammaproteobacteria bacterium]|nr:hypothetical protein [Gammaproteobacteria bacterium]